MRQHGTYTKFVTDRCRCEPCVEAHRAYNRHARREQAYGRWEPYVDAEPVRAHIRGLMAQGMGWKRVARAAGLSPSTVWKTVYGDRTRFDGPTKRVTRKTAEAILAVELDLAPGAVIEAHGTRRRLQALVALGWSQSKLAKRIGMNDRNFSTMLLHRSQVTVATAAKVKAVYDELSMTPPAPADKYDLISINRAKNRAAWLMWPPPLAWDDDTIDDPFATPADVNPADRRKSHLVENFDWLLEQRESPAQAADRLGVDLASIDRARARQAAA